MNYYRGLIPRILMMATTTGLIIATMEILLLSAYFFDAVVMTYALLFLYLFLVLLLYHYHRALLHQKRTQTMNWTALVCVLVLSSFLTDH
jgi:hypothetical protein